MPGRNAVRTASDLDRAGGTEERNRHRAVVLRAEVAFPADSVGVRLAAALLAHEKVRACVSSSSSTRRDICDDAGGDKVAGTDGGRTARRMVGWARDARPESAATGASDAMRGGMHRRPRPSPSLDARRLSRSEQPLRAAFLRKFQPVPRVPVGRRRQVADPDKGGNGARRARLTGEGGERPGWDSHLHLVAFRLPVCPFGSENASRRRALGVERNAPVKVEASPSAIGSPGLIPAYSLVHFATSPTVEDPATLTPRRRPATSILGAPGLRPSTPGKVLEWVFGTTGRHCLGRVRPRRSPRPEPSTAAPCSR